MTRIQQIVVSLLVVCAAFGQSKPVAAAEQNKSSFPPFRYDLLQSDLSTASRVCGPARTEFTRQGLLKDDPSMSASRPIHVRLPATYENSVRPASGERSSPAQAVNVRISDTTPHQQHEAISYATDQAHADCFADDPFPSAAKCQICHPGHYREWSVSAHAYAQLSPVFNAMSNRLIEGNNGTLGDFCIRCHTPVGMALDEPINMSQMDRHPAAREGVTCVVCHRVNQNWGKGSGRLALVAGGLTAPIYGPTGNQILAEVLANPDRYGVMRTDDAPTSRGREVHAEVVPFFALTTPAVCGSCHDVFAPNGFRLEDAFSEFKTSPAAREKFQNCQDCHMGLSPGEASGYAFAPAAKVGNAWTQPRKRTNHMMAGPDHSVIHPGLFPHNPDAVREEHAVFVTGPETGLATMREWLQFDYRAGWGTEQFERNLPDGYSFPAAWESQTRRLRAADILRDQFDLLDELNLARHQVLSVGYRLGDIVLDKAGRDGIRFRVNVFNGTDGHGVPTGFDAERLVFLRVTVWDRNGKLVFVSGDLDPNGDVRDSHSFYVHNDELPLDRQLFSLQTKFITRNVRGGEREQILTIPFSLDPLPYFRPETRPFTVLGRPVGARKHKQNIEVGGERWAKYHIGRSQLTCNGPYDVHVDLVAGMVPVNLVHEISSVGFDYHMSAREVADAVVAGHMILHSATATFHVDQ
ncbi:MAG TPA: multiheme c-type cytochrome [Pirellulaceae bacterium]|nr:multiheme c-type cytochrome [Pirellulaceae bacterium]